MRIAMKILFILIIGGHFNLQTEIQKEINY